MKHTCVVFDIKRGCDAWTSYTRELFIVTFEVEEEKEMFE